VGRWREKEKKFRNIPPKFSDDVLCPSLDRLLQWGGRREEEGSSEVVGGRREEGGKEKF
jgi:hypothetical protein